MGSCVSVRLDSEPATFRHAVGTNAWEVIPPPAAMGGAHSGLGLPAGGFDSKKMPEEAGLGFSSSRFGTTDETFFDSQECFFESDCEDDFFSVNGDFTPSRAGTPNYQTGTPSKQQLQKAALTFDEFSEDKSETFPQKTLAELLQETMPGEPAGNEYNAVDGKIQVNGKSESKKTNMDQLPNSLDGTPYLSMANPLSGETTPDGNFGNGKGKRGKANKCCLPSLVHSLSFSEKKGTPSPRCHGGG